MTVKKQIVVFVALIAIALGGYQGWQHLRGDASDPSKRSGPQRKPVAVVTASISATQMDRVIEAVGTTKALRSVEITPLSSGRVESINLTNGRPVKANAKLLELDSVIQEADVVEAKAKLEEASRALKRSDSLKQSSGMSEATIDSLRAQVQIAGANLERAKKRLADRVIRAPFAGMISLSSIEKGARIKEGDVVAVLDDLSQVIIEFSVPEDLFGALKPGETLLARAASMPGREFVGEISAVDTRIDYASRSFKVRGLIDNSDRALPAGMFIHVSIIVGGEMTLVVPEEAVIVESGQQFVFALQPGKEADTFRVERRNITLGRRALGIVEVKDGLKEGEDVVTQGLQKVRHGATVKKRGSRDNAAGTNTVPDSAQKSAS